MVNRLAVTSLVSDAYQYYLQNKDLFNNPTTEAALNDFIQKYINEPKSDTKNRLPTLSDAYLVGLKHQDWSPEQIQAHAGSTVSFEEDLRYYMGYCESVRDRPQVKLGDPEAQMMCSYFKSKFSFPTKNTSGVTVPGISMTVKKVLDPDTLIACDDSPDGECHKIRLAGADGEETYNKSQKAKREFSKKLELLAIFVKGQNPDLALKLSNPKLVSAMEGAIGAATEYRGKLGTLLFEHFTSYYGGHIEAEPSYANDGHLEGLCVFGRFLGWIKGGSVSNYLTNEQKGLPALASGQMKELYTNMRAAGETELAKVNFARFGLTAEDQSLVKDLFMSYFIDPAQTFGPAKSNEMAVQWETFLKEFKAESGVDYSTNFNLFEIIIGLADSTAAAFPNIRGEAIIKAQEIAKKGHYGRYASKMFSGAPRKEENLCPPFRINNEDLPTMINAVLKEHGFSPIDEDDIEDILSMSNEDPREKRDAAYLQKIGVKHKKDKLSACENIKNEDDRKLAEVCPMGETRPLFESAKISTSQVEAARFYAQVTRYIDPFSSSFMDSNAGKIAFALKIIYFGDSPFFEARPSGTPIGVPPHDARRIRFKKKVNHMGGKDDVLCGIGTDGCYGHDLDTPNVSRFVPNQCYDKTSGYFGPARLLEIDSPELNDIPDTQEAKTWAMQLYRKDPHPTLPSKYINEKQVKNANKVIKTLATNPDAIPDDEKFALIRVIAARQTYLASVGWGIGEGFLGRIEDEEEDKQSSYRKAQDGGFIHSYGMTTRFLYPGESEWVCGEKQTYDGNGRSLEFPVVADPKLIYDYIDTGLATDIKATFAIDIKATDEKHNLYQTYTELVRERLAVLKNSTNEDVKSMVKILDPSTMPTPEDLYTVEETKKLHELRINHFTNKHPELAEDYEGSISAFYVGAGLVWGFRNFRNRDYAPVIAESEKDAVENGLGFYSDPTFKAVWQYNQKNPNPDCMTGEQ